MRIIGPLAAISMIVVSKAEAICVPVTSKSADEWASSIAKSAPVILVGEVVRQQDLTRKQRALLRPVTLYKGPKSAMFAMSLPPELAISESYAGYPANVGEQRFLILHATAKGYETEPCEEYIASNAGVREALVRRLSR